MFTLGCTRLACVAIKEVQHSLSQSLTRLLGSSPTAAAPERTEDNQREVLDQNLPPLLKMSYNDQLKRKQLLIESHIADLKQEFEDRCRKEERPIPSFEPFIHQICPSPVTEGYANLYQFEVCSGIDGNPKTVGRVTFCRQTRKRIAILSIRYMPLSVYKVAKAYEDFIRLSPLPSSYLMIDGGFWRELTVRRNELGQIMAVIMMNSRNATKDMIEEQQELLRQYFVEGPGADCRLHSLYSQAGPNKVCTNSQAPFILLHGKKYLEEELNGRMFYISPSTFFESNSKMTEVLCEKILSVANLSERTTLFDLYCGPGYVSIMASPHVHGTIGIDNRKDSIDDAIYNAAQNHLHGAHFIAGQFYSVLKTSLDELGPSPDIVAVLNPGSLKTSRKVTELLRNTTRFQKVVYVTPNLNHPYRKRDILNLIFPRRSVPFKISQVIPLDMYPNSLKYKLILSFDR